MAKEKNKKQHNDRDIKPEPEPLPSPRLPNEEEDDWDEINKEDEKKRIPVPPGEMPPLPIHAPTQPGPKAPIYV
jgi:hypothetical protein